MAHYGLDNTIVATNSFIEYEDNLKIIKEKIDEGLPVTLYALWAGSGKLGDHFINVYGYQDWIGYNYRGETITKTMLIYRSNWGTSWTGTYYVDSALLTAFFSGIIYYDIIYNPYHILADGLKMLVNDKNQGQYINEEKEKSIKVSDDLNVITRRLRGSYIENKHFVLSAISKNGTYVENEMQEAYLQLQFECDVRKIEFDLSLWSDNEQFTSESVATLDYYNPKTNQWETLQEFDLLNLPTKDNPEHFSMYLPPDAFLFRFMVKHPKVDADRNKGRLVIGEINLYMDNLNRPIHTKGYHTEGDIYQYVDEYTHRSRCECGEMIEQPHIYLESSIGNGQAQCLLCNQMVHAHSYTDFYKSHGKEYHIAYCECGDGKEMFHNVEYIGGIAHEEGQCTECGETKECGHIYKDTHIPHDLFNHKSYCECGEYKFEPHAVRAGDIQGGQTAICLICDGETSMGIIQYAPSSNRKRYTSENGSYILANGVIVLVDDDIDAYMNGTLVFKKK